MFSNLKVQFIALGLLALGCHASQAQTLKNVGKAVKEWTVPSGKISFNLNSGLVDYRFNNGAVLKNTMGYVDLLHVGIKTSASFHKHAIQVEDKGTAGAKTTTVIFSHEDPSGLVMKQIFTQKKGEQHLLLRLLLTSKDGRMLETRNISPLSLDPKTAGSAYFPWEQPIVVDLPFDNDNWGKLLALPWPKENQDAILDGVSHEVAMLYDQKTYKGLTIGSLEHDFWKTGITYKSTQEKGILTDFTTYGGAARPDNPNLPMNFGGQDGTHDVNPHGTMLATELRSPLIFLEASDDFRISNVNYGKAQVESSGSLTWNGNAPMYWNSFSVEGVLGHEGIMMPPDVYKIIDFIKGLDQLNKDGKPVLSIDSYDQGIYSTQVLKEIGDYARAHGQELGFYCSPFSLWTWSDQINSAILPGTTVPLREVILRDNNDKPIPFKDGQWGAFPMDPTHPATRASMINQIEKAHAIGAKFIKIDFLTAGSFEAKKWYNPHIRTGMQAYNYGMKTFKHLVDSIMGTDVFITMAISPMYPHQYAHTRFVSTDVHSHLRDSQPGFSHYGSTAASMITASHMGWVQGTLWPYTNMDNLVMRKFQQHTELTESEVKVRVISLVTMGSILGDGSDYRDPLSAQRAKKYLNNPAVAAYFRAPKAFMPLKLSEGESMDQQLSFYLPGEQFLLSAFNFDEKQLFEASFDLQKIGLPKGNYKLTDFFTGLEVGRIRRGDRKLLMPVKVRDAELWVVSKIN